VGLRLLFARSTPVRFLIVRNVKKRNNSPKVDDLTASIQNVMVSLTPYKLRQICLLRELIQKMLPYEDLKMKIYGHSHTKSRVTDAHCHRS
jgi:hypothetical protein